MLRIRKNDTVVITAGKDKGKTGKVIRVLPKKSAVIVEQVNIVKKHQKPSQENRTGGIIDKEAPIHLSNVMLLDGKTGKGTRYKISSGKHGDKVRMANQSGTVFD
ncbi:MAG: 50S ribosomal protein L24 [Proteobacteria bacterium]|nr:50S ribosomal protein L24 [Pseudomonadota bacterium]